MFILPLLLSVASAATLIRLPQIRLIEQQTQYALVLDAGSSGTRIFAYTYPNTPPPRNTLPQLQTVMTTTKKGNKKQWSVKKKPGLSTIEPQDVPTYLSELVDAAKAVIPPAAYPNTPIVLRATAGMRLLTDDKRKALLDAVRSFLGDASNHPFLFDRVKGALVISGEHEGVLAYLAVNYLTAKLNTTQSYAVADLGGASTQLTFATKDIPLARSFDVILPGIGKKETVYVNSYLGFGENESKRRHNLNLANEAIGQGVGQMVDPCGWKGNQETVVVQDKTVTLTGAFDAERCTQYATKLLGLDTWCSQPPCAMIGVYQPVIPETTPLFALSNYAQVAEAFGCPMGLGPISCLDTNSRTQCSATNTIEAKNKWTDLKDNDFNKLCFLARFAVQVLTQGYKLPLTREIYWGEEMERVELSWTWGAVLEGLLQNVQ